MHFFTISNTSTLRVLLATAQVGIYLLMEMLVRALIDQGSDISLISERIVQRSKMSRTRSTVSLVDIDGKVSNRTRGSVNFSLSPHFQSDFECTITAHVLINLTSSIPSIPIDQTL